MRGTTLAVQGPPGTGKTYLAAKACAHLVRQGYKVGIARLPETGVGSFLKCARFKIQKIMENLIF